MNNFERQRQSLIDRFCPTCKNKKQCSEGLLSRPSKCPIIAHGLKSCNKNTKGE